MRGLFIDPGLFRHEMTVEAAERVSDGHGGYAEVWGEVATVMAQLEPQAPRPADADQALTTTGFRVRLRHRAGLASGMRLRRGARIFTIDTVVDPDESGRYMVCQATEHRQ